MSLYPVAHKGFPKQQKLIQAYQDDFQLSLDVPARDQNRGLAKLELFSEFIKGLRVTYKCITGKINKIMTSLQSAPKWRRSILPLVNLVLNI